MKQIGDKKVFTVGEVNAIAKETLEFLTFWVEGEISSVQKNPNWYYAYFSLKENEDILPCFLEPKLLLNSNFLEVGQSVQIYGMLTLFKKSEYKMRVFRIEHAGEGILQKQFEALYQKLKKEGLFDKKHKKNIPTYPKKVCVITSINSAGWNDFKTHTIEKYPLINLYSVDVRVEGQFAAEKLVKVLSKIDKFGFDTVVITRGGGSQESLMAVFNDEQLTRSIFKLKTPIIVAIGHEVNTSLAELAADRRASTPTDAASIITAGYTSVSDRLENLKYVLKLKADHYFSVNFQKLDHLYFALQKSKISFKDLPLKLKNLQELLKHQGNLLINSNAQRLKLSREKLSLLSYDNTLKRGYSMTFNSQGKIIRSVVPVVVGAQITVKLSDGSLFSKVTKKKYG